MKLKFKFNGESFKINVEEIVFDKYNVNFKESETGNVSTFEIKSINIKSAKFTQETKHMAEQFYTMLLWSKGNEDLQNLFERHSIYPAQMDTHYLESDADTGEFEFIFQLSNQPKTVYFVVATIPQYCENLHNNWEVNQAIKAKRPESLQNFIHSDIVEIEKFEYSGEPMVYYKQEYAKEVADFSETNRLFHNVQYN